MTEWQPRVGVCCGADAAWLASQTGADYVELPAVGLANLTPEQASQGWKAETTNLFLPGDFRLCGPEKTPPEALWAYVEDTLGRAAKLGIQLMVVGSGGARRAPEGFDLDEAHTVFVDFVEQVQRRASAYGIHMAPESLNRTETNVATDLGVLARMLRERRLAYTCDTRHVLAEWNLDHGKELSAASVPSVAYLEDQIPFAPAHLHLATVSASPPLDTDLGVWAVLERVQSLGFRGRVSFECRWEAMESQLPPAKRLVIQALRGGTQ